MAKQPLAPSAPFEPKRMVMVPAIDLLQGRLVRLVQGQYDQILAYGQGPVRLAQAYCHEGAEGLHVIDLDGARLGSWQNLQLIGEIVRSALRLGVERVVISTAALGDPAQLRRLVTEFDSQLVVSLDARAGDVVTEGWTVGTGMGLMDAARRVVETGVSRLIYTDVLRDGTLSGPGLAGLERLLPLGVPVMVAGGVTTYQDLERLRGAGAEAAIVGRALLDGTISLPAAIAAAGGAAPAPAEA
jgi:phosphoribosylformimino-5-aminoimidazole carboxamide ribotide isomerase